jgi:hypothetical protein
MSREGPRIGMRIHGSYAMRLNRSIVAALSLTTATLAGACASNTGSGGSDVAARWRFHEKWLGSS